MQTEPQHPFDVEWDWLFHTSLNCSENANEQQCIRCIFKKDCLWRLDEPVYGLITQKANERLERHSDIRIVT